MTIMANREGHVCAVVGVTCCLVVAVVDVAPLMALNLEYLARVSELVSVEYEVATTAS